MLLKFRFTEGTNVVGLQDILRLATQSKIKPVHFISTVAVFDHEDGEKGKIFTEADMPEKNAFHDWFH